MKHVDAAIIGFGTAGKTLALALGDAGLKVAVIEQSERMYGGTCPNVACIPTKALAHAAQISAIVGGSFVKQAERYAAAIDEKDQLVRSMRMSAYQALGCHPHIEVIDGTASFLAPNMLSLTCPNGTEELEADEVFIATGSCPIMPDVPGADGTRVCTSESLIARRVLPERLVIIGGGHIGMEFAFMYRNFGSKVTVLQKGPGFLSSDDADIAHAVRARLEACGIRLFTNAETTAIEEDAGQALVVAQCEGKTLRMSGDVVLVAIGRRPNLDSLNIQAAGIDLTRHGGVETDEHLRATTPHVWALGDVRGKHQHTYIAYDDCRIAASDMLGDGSRTTHSRGEVPYAVFTDPPFSRVGLTEEEARKAGFAVRTATLEGSSIARAHIDGKPVGLMKAVVDANTNLILGMHLFCECSPELINLAKVAMDARLPYTTLRDAMYTHPTMAEALSKLLARIA